MKEEAPKVRLRSGREMPALGLGTWQLKDETIKAVGRALQLGYRMIDTSSDYGTQPAIGVAINDSHLPREDIFLVTKVEETDNAYERAQSNLEQLKMEYVDMLLIHRPPHDTAGEKLWRDLIKCQQEGLAKEIGVSNYSVDLMEQLTAATGQRPAVNQIEWSPFGHSLSMKKYCDENGIMIQAYSPLSRAKRLDNEVLTRIGENHRRTAAQVILRWNYQDGTVPIPKAQEESHQEENLNIWDFELSDAEMVEISRLNEEYSALGALPYV